MKALGTCNRPLENPKASPEEVADKVCGCRGRAHPPAESQGI